ncbi:PepSY domain-containing protein [Actinoplanes sp. NPDC089786]|uniref:PepSY domain-containing protein n=1 Tax=Actinoplanes sp. NPDC089786 TaxID=3155185 RepID=UPI0034458A1F
MNKVRKVTAITVGAVAALAVGGAALAAGADDPSPEATSGAVTMLPNGDVAEPTATESAGASPSPSSSTDDSPNPSSSASSSSASSSPSSSSPSSRSATSAAGIGIDRARAIAIRAAGGGRVESVERETEHGRAVWDVDVIVNGVEHDIDVDRSTGAVTRHRVKGSDDDRGRSGSDDRGGHGSDDKGGDDRGGRHGGHGSDD